MFLCFEKSKLQFLWSSPLFLANLLGPKNLINLYFFVLGARTASLQSARNLIVFILYDRCCWSPSQGMCDIFNPPLISGKSELRPKREKGKSDSREIQMAEIPRILTNIQEHVRSLSSVSCLSSQVCLWYANGENGSQTRFFGFFCLFSGDTQNLKPRAPAHKASYGKPALAQFLGPHLHFT